MNSNILNIVNMSGTNSVLYNYSWFKCYVSTRIFFDMIRRHDSTVMIRPRGYQARRNDR